MPNSCREGLKKDNKQMIDSGVIRESDSPYSSPIVVVRKNVGSYRQCIDIRKCNRATCFDSEPMVKPQNTFAKVGNDTVYSKFDMTKGYCQIPMRKEDIGKTSFVTPDGC